MNGGLKMKKYLKNKFALTDSGAKDVLKASLNCFVVYCLNMMPAFLLMFLLDDILISNHRSNKFYLIFAISSLAILNLMLRVEYESLYNTTYKESANLRIELAEILRKLPLFYFSKHDISDISQTIMSDIEGIEHAMSHAIPKIVGFLLFFPIISIMMFTGNVKLALSVILPTILGLGLMVVSKKIQIKGHDKYYKVLRDNSEYFQEAIELQQEIKSYNAMRRMRRFLYQKMEQSEAVHIKEEAKLVTILGFSSIFGFLSLGIVILVGINLLISKEINILYLLGYLFAAMKIKDVVDASKEEMAEIFYLSPKIKRIKEIRDFDFQKGEDVELNNFDIVLKNVSFSYDEDTQVLDNISFTAKQNEVTALVGPSGCGKTSVLRLISRLYDYDEGQILIDNKEIKNISTESLFSKISIVFQDVVLFNNSVMENIRLGRQDATDDEVIRAAVLSGCDEFVSKMEHGYDTVIGENGTKISGGERQRISIARAFLKDAPILILDEIAANLDVENEKKIQKSLNKLMENKTVIIISHRMKAIENVDKIVVMKDKKVDSIGTHDELLEKSPVYKKLIDNSKMAEEFTY